MVFVIAMSIIYKSKFYNAGFGISDHPMAYDTKIGVTKNRHRGFQMSSVCCCWVETTYPVEVYILEISVKVLCKNRK